MANHLMQTNFTGGEWSELLEGRVDLEKYGNAVRRMENFLIDPRGPTIFRPGLRFIAGTKTNAKTSRLIPFEFSVTQAYVLEFGDQYIRFFRNQAQITTAPATPYEIASPYLEADVASIKICQSADVIYLFHSNYAPRKLSRTGHTAWVLTTINFRPPALKEQGIKPATTLTLGAVSGSGITFTAGAATFLDGDVGRVITSGVGRASITGFTSTTVVTCDIMDTFAAVGPLASQSWSLTGSPGGDIGLSGSLKVGSSIFLASALDCFRAADIGKYIRVHNGLVRITVYTTASIIKAEIIKSPTAITSTTNWTMESDVWNATNGYPSCGTFYEERLVLAGSTAYPETIWGSVVGDYENFTPGIDDSDAYEFTLAGQQVSVILWLAARERLIVGAAGGEWTVGPGDAGSSLTPLNVIAKEVQTYGSANIPPITATGSTLFVQRAGRKLREFAYQWEEDGYVAPDLTLLADHVAEGALTEIVYQQEPFSIVWGRTATGNLSAMTYLRDQDVVGWHRHPTDGLVESLAVIPGDGYDEVWAIVNRTINGATVRYVEMLEKFFTDTPAAYTASKGLNAFFVDSGITYNGAATVTITGLGHLVGKTVAILADGSVVANKVVSAGGTITLGTAASVVHAGLPYTGTLQTMRMDTNLQDGTGQGREKKIHDITLRVYRSGSFKAGRNESNLDGCFDRERTLTLGAPYPLFTGDIRLGFDGAWEKDGRMMFVQDRPMPLTLVAVMLEVSVK